MVQRVQQVHMVGEEVPELVKMELVRLVLTERLSLPGMTLPIVM
jgi:hypothetical protein